MLEVLQCLDRDCVIVDKVFAACQQRECFPGLEYDLDECEFDTIKFRPGFIVPNTLIVTDVIGRPNFRRVRFTIRIPFQVLDDKGNVVDEFFLPDIFKDVILYIPDARDEFDFRIVVETQSVLLCPPEFSNGELNITVGVFIIIKVVGTVQLLIPAFGYCPEPPACEEFSPEDVCEQFECEEFPEFFPPQLNDLQKPNGIK
ncbi:hypothetical protein E9840_09965 [Tissierella creatinini]|nr:hypothetical protein E9840_09965 [Tissierella creatinini]TJX64446.1 hypothetical protein E8P77_12195 [Soehngenia saccharolytica]